MAGATKGIFFSYSGLDKLEQVGDLSVLINKIKEQYLIQAVTNDVPADEITFLMEASRIELEFDHTLREAVKLNYFTPSGLMVI